MEEKQKIVFYNDVFSVVRNYVEYEYYKKSPELAAAAIRRKYKEKTLEETLRVFTYVGDAYQQAISFVEKHQDYYRDLFQKNASTDFSTDEMAFFKQFQNIPPPLLGGILHFIYDWHYLR